MLLGLRLRDFVIVDEAELEFGAGFTVLSGETGAGKSILLDALGLAMGGRADAGVVREGAARADITAVFRSSPELDAWLAERELAGDPGSVLLRRVVDADGRSRGLVNGNPATAALLRELGERLVDIRGEHAAQSLLRAGGQRVLLDAWLRASRKHQPLPLLVDFEPGDISGEVPDMMGFDVEGDDKTMSYERLLLPFGFGSRVEQIVGLSSRSALKTQGRQSDGTAGKRRSGHPAPGRDRSCGPGPHEPRPTSSSSSEL